MKTDSQTVRQTDRQAQLTTIQGNLSGTITLDVKKYSFKTGGLSRQVQFAWDLMVDRNFQELENGQNEIFYSDTKWSF